MINDIIINSSKEELPITNELILWLDFSTVSNIILESGNTLSSIRDKSPKRYLCSQSNPSKRPIYNFNLFNGLGGIVYDGSNDCLQIPLFSCNSFITVFHVVKPRSGALSKPFFLEHSADTNSYNGFFVYFRSGPDISVRRSPNINSNSTVVLNTMESTNVILSTHIFDGSLDSGGIISRIRKNKTELSTLKHFTNSNVTVSNTLISDTLNIGARNNGASIQTSGSLHELIIFNRVLPDSEIIIMENYLNLKWKI